jgi:hypothetical protein
MLQHSITLNFTHTVFIEFDQPLFSTWKKIVKYYFYGKETMKIIWIHFFTTESSVELCVNTAVNSVFRIKAGGFWTMWATTRFSVSSCSEWTLCNQLPDFYGIHRAPQAYVFLLQAGTQGLSKGCCVRTPTNPHVGFGRLNAGIVVSNPAQGMSSTAYV